MKDEVQMIRIDQIRILNPRTRDKRKFEQIVESIKNQGLKMPIKISSRIIKEGEEPGYDLICGQGRIEAFTALGHQEIPAIVVEVAKADRLLMSIVENMARRFPAPLDLIIEIERLKSEGYNNVAIGKKLGIQDTLVGGLLVLRNSGEERLLDAAVKGKVPLGVAIDIAKADTTETQRELLKAYESGQLNHASILTVKRLIEHRKFLGKTLRCGDEAMRKKNRTTAASLVNAFRKETQRQKVLIKKHKLCEAKLIVLVRAFKHLFDDENFVNLLRVEKLSTFPKFLSEKLHVELKDAL